MLKNYSTHIWLAGFADRLMELFPNMSLGAAVSRAVLTFHHGCDLDPGAAAELFVRINPHDPALRPLVPRSTGKRRAPAGLLAALAQRAGASARSAGLGI